MRRPVFTIPRAVFDDRLLRAVVDRGATLSPAHRAIPSRSATGFVVLDGTPTAHGR